MLSSTLVLEGTRPPKWTQKAPNWTLDRPKWAQMGPQTALKGAQNRPEPSLVKRLKEGIKPPEMDPKGPKLDLGSSYSDPPKWTQMGPRPP